MRQHICGLLSDDKNEQSIEPLIRTMLNDPDNDVRRMAAWALGKLRDKRALPALRWVQEHDHGAGFEGRTVSDEAARAIENILEDSEPEC